MLSSTESENISLSLSLSPAQLTLLLQLECAPFISGDVKHSNVRKIYFDKNVIAVCKKSIPLLHHY